MSVELEERLANATVRYAGETQDEATIRRNNAIKEAADTLRRYREALERIRKRCDDLKMGTDDWFELTEFSVTCSETLQVPHD